MTEKTPPSAIEDPLLEPFWAAAREDQLVIPQCGKCSYSWWPPEPVCPQCLAPNPRWRRVEGRGTLWSYAIYHRGFSPEFADQIPYAVGLIELEAGPKMYALLLGPVESWSIGQELQAAYGASGTLVRWQAIDPAHAENLSDDERPTVIR